MGIFGIVGGLFGCGLLFWGSVQIADRGFNAIVIGVIVLLASTLLFLVGQRAEREWQEAERHRELIDAIRGNERG